MSKHKAIDVAVGVVWNGREVLIAQRLQGSHQGGKWEFPGGKCEAGEQIEDALVREFIEEVGIRPLDIEPLITLSHRYPEKTVTLHVWNIFKFTGQPRGCEGQAIRWESVDTLQTEDFPAANRAIIQALRLPPYCLITPDRSSCTEEEFLNRIASALDQGIQMLQLRSHSLKQDDYLDLAGKVQMLCQRKQGVQLMLNMPAEWLAQSHKTGLHLSSHRLLALKQRPENLQGCLSAACHNLHEIEQAQALGMDFLYISPVKATATHPGTAALGWDGFATLCRQANLPVYALGGLAPVDLSKARACGGTGIAASRAFW